MNIRALTPAEMRPRLAALQELLIDAVASGASVGYLHPLPPELAAQYWAGVLASVAAAETVLLVAEAPDGSVCGTVQLVLATKPNAPHRAEVSKLLVHSAYRRQGIGRALLHALETHARRHQRSTLVLDTRRGDVSEQLYRQTGYTLAGEIPAYVRNEAGELQSTMVYYKLLTEAAPGTT
ncbi:GNAT family N-acetyltransferase [Hymenobacter latericus]|uniref:GNAT family N-acetyltransferase n=1 Tax=Hymenobacter sp. YIM 151858-1 TaxID=2987688 RepID=UPI002226435D|nr:N-acetyltransferase [Hymenobacter sp. YIM 151858-1]UYZ58245.1 GNAT family N-acetyltransferase [Hymenobacter sp. YIM 151858-1]